MRRYVRECGATDLLFETALLFLKQADLLEQRVGDVLLLFLRGCLQSNTVCSECLLLPFQRCYLRSVSRLKSCAAKEQND
jgi:hypothetical protein